MWRVCLILKWFSGLISRMIISVASLLFVIRRNDNSVLILLLICYGRFKNNNINGIPSLTSLLLLG
jgi:hypothetical protein